MPKTSKNSLDGKIPLNFPARGNIELSLKATQGWKNTQDNAIWKKDLLHGDWDVTDRNGKKVKEIDFTGRQIWPSEPKHKHKKS